jgi:hypothetical protein
MLEADQIIEGQRCSGCGGRNAHHAAACEFCARLLVPTTLRLPQASWVLALLLGLVLVGVLLFRLIGPLAMS